MRSPTAYLCDGCITVHTGCSRTGANKEEIAEALGVVVSVNTGAAIVYFTRTLDTFGAAADINLRDRAEAGVG